MLTISSHGVIQVYMNVPQMLEHAELTDIALGGIDLAPSAWDALLLRLPRVAVPTVDGGIEERAGLAHGCPAGG